MEAGASEALEAWLAARSSASTRGHCSQRKAAEFVAIAESGTPRIEPSHFVRVDAPLSTSCCLNCHRRPSAESFVSTCAINAGA